MVDYDPMVLRCECRTNDRGFQSYIRVLTYTEADLTMANTKNTNLIPSFNALSITNAQCVTSGLVVAFLMLSFTTILANPTTNEQEHPLTSEHLPNESEHLDTDGDGIKNGSDDDDDGDGVEDGKDAFPLDSAEWADSDKDGHGDNSDAFPNDPNEWSYPDVDLEDVRNNVISVESVENTGKSAEDYCGNYAKAYANSKTYVLASDSIRVKKQGKITQSIFNRFQPSGSRFLAGFDCRFDATSTTGKRRRISVKLYVVETLEFAEFTQWERLQIIPIQEVEDTTTGLIGYGVFKYLKDK